jgi:ribosome-binding factor A
MRRQETAEGRSVRLLRVGEQVRHVLSELLQRGEVHDDTLQSHLVSVTEVRMSPDLRHATVFVKPLLGEDEEKVLKALRQNTAFFQREVAHRVRTKYAAKLKFLVDESFDEGSHIDRILRSEHVAQDLNEE